VINTELSKKVNNKKQYIKIVANWLDIIGFSGLSPAKPMKAHKSP
jgi:hypothetical protein